MLMPSHARSTVLSRHSWRIAMTIAALIVTNEYSYAATAAETCLAANQNLSLGAPLPRTASLMKANKPLTIVAIGSSSTVSLWMSDPAKTYPGVMRNELTRLNPALRVAIVNSGKSGDTIPGNIARFDADVFAHRPDLVVWQLGGNDFTWLESGESLEQKIASGIRALRGRGADVVLMDQQYTPVILATRYAKMQAAIAGVARQERVALFPRFELMRKAVQSGISIGALSAYDGLHMSADGYDCIGRALARAIAAAAK